MKQWIYRRSAGPLTALAAVLGSGCASGPAPAVGPNDGTALECTLSSNCVSSIAGDPAPLRFTGTPAQAMAALKATLAAFPEAVIEREQGLTLEAVFSTPAGFRDEVSFRIDAAGQRIDYRSRSRIGLYDFGKNRSRMAAFKARFEALASR